MYAILMDGVEIMQKIKLTVSQWREIAQLNKEFKADLEILMYKQKELLGVSLNDYEILELEISDAAALRMIAAMYRFKIFYLYLLEDVLFQIK